LFDTAAGPGDRLGRRQGGALRIGEEGRVARRPARIVVSS